MIVVVGGCLAVQRFGIVDGVRLPMAAPGDDTLTATFPFCGEGRRKLRTVTRGGRSIGER